MKRIPLVPLQSTPFLHISNTKLNINNNNNNNTTQKRTIFTLIDAIIRGKRRTPLNNYISKTSIYNPDDFAIKYNSNIPDKEWQFVRYLVLLCTSATIGVMVIEMIFPDIFAVFKEDPYNNNNRW
eukprot:Tbor_TRINITY_DN5202_c4_g5::TRINITY_DN5202_c4_g5_i1::g.16679::m.16679